MPYVAVTSVVLAAFNLVQRGVGEVEFLSAVINGQAVGSLDVAADDHEHIGSIQRRPHDAGSPLIPVGPEHEAVVGNTQRINIMLRHESSLKKKSQNKNLLWKGDLKERNTRDGKKKKSK